MTGLSGEAYVSVDSLGVPHVFASDQATALFLQGYETARVRFWEMDAFRRVAEGRLSEIFGPVTLETDAEMRTVFTTRDGRRIEEALWDRLQEVDPQAVELALAYTAGVNAWLADLRAGRNGAKLPPEYTMALISLGPEDLEEWRPQDSLAIGRLQAWSLSETLFEEIGGAERVAALPEPLLLDTLRSAPAAPATVLPPAGARTRRTAAAPLRRPRALPPREVLRQVRELGERVARVHPFTRHVRGTGSNNWIVSPALSANGHAMLANDPHLALFNPPIWHMIQLDAGESGRINGVMFPGLPGIILGHNDYGAWGGTVAVFDVTDVYVETVTTPEDYPASPRTVLFRGEQVPVLRIEEPIRVKGNAEPFTLVIEVVPHHGPMVPDPDLNDDVEGLAATGMSFRWTGHEITVDFRFLNNLNKARNVEEFKAAIRDFAVGAQNWVWADVHGDIAYFPYTLVPQRPAGTVPYLPMDGTGGAEWLTDETGRTLWLPEEKFPQAVNPEEGFLATANNDQLGNTLDNDPLNDEVYFTFTADLGFREQRIQDLIRGLVATQGHLTVEDMSRIQYDTASLEASRLVPFLFAAAEARPDLVTPEMEDALGRLQAWGEEKPGSPAWDMAAGVDPAELRDDVPPPARPVTDEQRADAVAASIYAAWVTRLNRAVFADDFAGTGVGFPGGQDATKALLHILEDVDRTDPGFVVHTLGEDGQSTLWDNRDTPEVETRDEILLAALRDGLAFLRSRFGTEDPSQWIWGMIHQVNFQHFFGQAGLPFADLGPFPAPGGRWTVNPANFSLNSDNFVFSSGPSMRFVAVLDPAGIRAVNILPGGNNGDPGDLGAFGRIAPDIHYGDHIPGWIRGETFEMRVSREAVAADTQTLIRYLPLEAE